MVTFQFFIQDETETISDSEEEVDENNNKMQANSTILVISNTYSYVDLTEDDPVVVQVNLCQKVSFLHQLTQNMTTDCSLNYKFNT